MGDLWRSQPMQLVQLFINLEAAHDTVDELGELGLVQFRDLNPTVNAFQRSWMREVKRTEEMERQLRYFHSQLHAYNELAPKEGKEPLVLAPAPADVRHLQLDDLAGKFEDLEKTMKEMVSFQEALYRNRNGLVEYRYTLQNDERFFAAGGINPDILASSAVNDSTSLLDYEGFGGSSPSVKLGFVTGVIERAQFNVFERILFRATRGNLYLRYAEVTDLIVDPTTGKEVHKNVFIVFFQGDKLQTKIKKICESFGCNLYNIPDTAMERQALAQQVESRLDEHNVTLEGSWKQRTAALGAIANEINGWFVKVRKEKAIYHTMNLFNFDVGRKCLIAEGWVPTKSLEQVNIALRRAKDRSGAQVPSFLTPLETHEVPPTYFETNKFTAGFQSIIDAYGIPRYQEINPAVFSIVTFPFMFGIMFGDVGHGLGLLAFALFMIYKEKEWAGQKLNELLELPFAGRYVILLMALFAMYCGLLYNEFLSVPLKILPTAWTNCENGGQCDLIVYKPGDGKPSLEGYPKRTYELGIDWMWKGAENELIYYNSLKMKMSIIIGVTHMSLGIIMKFLNSIYFNNKLDLFFECIPQLVLLLALFGYLAALMFIKWCYPFYTYDRLNISPHVGDAPLLLTTMIFMFLSPTKSTFDLFKGQVAIQITLILIALVSVPTMLLVKPLALKFMHNSSYAVLGDEDEENIAAPAPAAGGHGHGHGDHFDFGEIFIHQIIETIEFVLGTVSNTASYLRLWALSLAHSELATVFWTLGLTQLGLGLNPFVTFAVWAVFCGASVGVLMILETLSAFLHALRLHWVEFMNKFFKGDGHAFAPFSYHAIPLSEI
jgi:V-type H+-transporting ATPase subunit a